MNNDNWNLPFPDLSNQGLYFFSPLTHISTPNFEINDVQWLEDFWRTYGVSQDSSRSMTALETWAKDADLSLPSDYSSSSIYTSPPASSGLSQSSIISSSTDGDANVSGSSQNAGTVSWQLDVSSLPDANLAVPGPTSYSTGRMSFCQCSIKIKKAKRHWDTICPYNPNKMTRPVCPICNKLYSRIDIMNRHIREVHGL